MPEQSTPPTCVTCGRPRAGYGGGEPYCWMHSAGSGLALDAPPPAAAPSPSTVDAVARFFRALFGDEYDGSEEWDAHHDALNVLLAVVRREEQQKAAVEDERVRIRARDALASALTRAEQAERALETTAAALDRLIPIADRAEQAEVELARSQHRAADFWLQVQDANDAKSEAEARVQGITAEVERLRGLFRYRVRVHKRFTPIHIDKQIPAASLEEAQAMARAMGDSTHEAVVEFRADPLWRRIEDDARDARLDREYKRSRQ